MNITSELVSLAVVAVGTGLMWVPYTLARIKTRGLVATLGNPNPALAPDPQWAQRARMAHSNAIENLAVFAPLVLILATLGVSTPATVLAAKLYVGARLVHFVVYAAGIPVIRTAAFIAGVVAMLVLAAAVYP
ncbi:MULTISPECIES: MAPEG family protein [unclassified Pseudomonas]|uniref:MAPEG family protein n=1 Tax=unclassified Pseudomonas TaxID=196821 RepID=UPI0015A38A32|nr:MULTISPECIES: MAPEG family protein [unclassified Pseudomonas]NWC95051.1 MAPEG family protein [Pseudomonas sp. IPO3779]NWD18289.1 MAPEG family protein [Pseudomonas sp. IPO3778]